MPVPENLLKKRLAAGEVVYGAWLGMGEAYAAEMAVTAGFDWLLIDGEHAPNDVRSLSAQVAVVLPSASAAVVRPVNDDPALIKQMLDIGVQTLLVPMVESADQARRILAATRYAPHGIRGVGASLARASKFGQISDYIATANGQICLILQVESRAGLAALDEMLTIDGVDGLFIGPSDLAADMGHPGNAAHPEVRAAVFDALRRIRAAGKTAGVLAIEAEFIQNCVAAGANFVGVGIDVLVYVGAMRGLVAKYKAKA